VFYGKHVSNLAGFHARGKVGYRIRPGRARNFLARRQIGVNLRGYYSGEFELPRLFAFVIMLAFSSISPAFAQKILYGSFVYHQAYPDLLFLNGPITTDSPWNFRKALRDQGATTLVLNSPGGSVSGGLEVSAIVNDRRMATLIPDGADCASACSFIYFAGSPRRIFGRLGVHQFASNSNTQEAVNETEIVTQAVSAQIIDYLKGYDTPTVVFVRMLETPPKQMYFFTPAEIEREGLETVLGLEQLALEQYRGVLSDIGLAPAAAPQAPQTPAATVQPDPVELPPTVSIKPSFDCGKASIPTEFALCRDSVLAAYDLEMVRVYKGLRRRLDKAGAKRLLADQRKWLKVRNGCGGDAPCLLAIYQQRIRVLDQ
jgi:uncharacterized protein YecT (DUF1311 family)/ATP-dependent protease ClpP protease subunit